MAGGGAGGAPYWAVAQLWAWATDRWTWIDGELLLAGVDIETTELPAHRILNMAYALMARVFGEVNRDEITRKMDDYLRRPPAPERETWGMHSVLTPEQRLTLSQYGPRPGFRPTRKKSATDEPSEEGTP